MKEIINSIISVICTGFIFLLGGVDVALTCLLVAIVLDYISGIMKAYINAIASGRTDITDDSMVMESFGEEKVHFVMGQYDNIKLTTPEDMVMGMAILRAKTGI